MNEQKQEKDSDFGANTEQLILFTAQTLTSAYILYKFKKL